MPGVIQPQRPKNSLDDALSIGQTALQMKGGFGGSGSQQAPGQTAADASPGESSADAAQGQATPKPQLGDYPTGNVYQRRIQRSY